MTPPCSAGQTTERAQERGEKKKKEFYLPLCALWPWAVEICHLPEWWITAAGFAKAEIPVHRFSNTSAPEISRVVRKPQFPNNFPGKTGNLPLYAANSAGLVREP
jgi:hypothetical protein